MSKLQELINELCPNGVEYKPLWSLTIWDKKFNSVDKTKQKKVIKYNYLLAADLKQFEKNTGNVKILTTSVTDLWADENDVQNIMSEGEIVCIPWGGNPIVQYYNGKFITGDNRIATSIDTSLLSNKYLYYYLNSQISFISSIYRGSGIKHPDMSKVLDMKIPVPPLPVQEEIVRILDKMTGYVTELKAELKARKMQYEYYRDDLLAFGNSTSKGKIQELVKKLCPDGVEYKTLKNVSFMKRGESLTKAKSTPGKYPVISGGKSPAFFCDKYNREGETITIAGSGAGAGYVQYFNKPIFANDCFTIKGQDGVNTKYLYYCLTSKQDYIYSTKKGGGVPHVHISDIENMEIPIPPLPIQEEIVRILDKFNSICNNISTGLPAEIEARQKQYEYYRDKLLSFRKLENEEC